MKDLFEELTKRKKRVPADDAVVLDRINQKLEGYRRINATIGNTLYGCHMQDLSDLETVEQVLNILIEQNHRLQELYIQSLTEQDRQIIITTEDKINSIKLRFMKENLE